MGFENWNKKPQSVREAARHDDQEALSSMGRKGAEVANAKRENQKDEAETWEMIKAEKARREECERAQSANEHIIDPDGNDLDYNPET